MWNRPAIPDEREERPRRKGTQAVNRSGFVGAMEFLKRSSPRSFIPGANVFLSEFEFDVLSIVNERRVWHLCFMLSSSSR